MFVRRDALHRHIQSHDGPSLVQQGNRACISCASAKSRCSGDTPCKRCYDRSAACVYPSQDIDTPMPSGSEIPGNAMGEMSSTVPLSEIQSSLSTVPDQLQNNSMTQMSDYSYQPDWDGFFHETNWLEAPINAEMHWSPLSVCISIVRSLEGVQDTLLTLPVILSGTFNPTITQ